MNVPEEPQESNDLIVVDFVVIPKRFHSFIKAHAERVGRSKEEIAREFVKWKLQQ